VKITRQTTLGQLPLHKAGFYEDEYGTIVTLFMDDGDYVVGTFNEEGFCTKHARFGTKKAAWQHFIGNISDDVGIEVQIRQS
jgi:hypothetical protein